MNSLHKFYFDAITSMREQNSKGGKIRYGQGMFNHLYSVRPELADAVRATDADPFYASSPTDPRFDKFVDFIEKNWYK